MVLFIAASFWFDAVEGDGTMLINVDLADITDGGDIWENILKFSQLNPAVFQDHIHDMLLQLWGKGPVSSTSKWQSINSV